jgi:plastocyanin domain-containing protein
VLLAAWTGLIWWFFFGPRKTVAAQAAAGGIQELAVVVQGGYSPARIVVQQGIPVRLKFRRLESASCSERVVFPDFDIARRLPEGEETVIAFTPERDGAFTFTCGMGMYQGTLVVEGGGRS